jgi:hypothetical protein
VVNLFQIIDPEAIQEIYADSEYTGERQLVYLLVRSDMDVTMCLKQNRKIRKWKEETLAQADWRPYGKQYRIASRDFRLPETNKAFRFVVKQNAETHVTRCFGSTHTELSATKSLIATISGGRLRRASRTLSRTTFSTSPRGILQKKWRSTIIA